MHWLKYGKYLKSKMPFHGFDVVSLTRQDEETVSKHFSYSNSYEKSKYLISNCLKVNFILVLETILWHCCIQRILSFWQIFFLTFDAPTMTKNYFDGSRKVRWQKLNLAFYLSIYFYFSLNYHYQTSTHTNLYLKIAFTDYLLHIYLLVSSEWVEVEILGHKTSISRKCKMQLFSFSLRKIHTLFSVTSSSRSPILEVLSAMNILLGSYNCLFVVIFYYNNEPNQLRIRPSSIFN